MRACCPGGKLAARLRYKVVSFDFDGTLADSADWFVEILNQVAGEFGFKRLNEEDRIRLRHLDTRAILKTLEIPLWKLPKIMARLRSAATEKSHEISMFSGVSQMFETIAASGTRIVIVSSNAETTVRNTLGPGISALVADYACGASLFGKAGRLKSILRRERIAPSELIYIGDETRDAEAARQAGTHFGAVAWGYASLEALAKYSPNLSFHTMDEIPAKLHRAL